jgi:hypothetical protein
MNRKIKFKSANNIKNSKKLLYVFTWQFYIITIISLYFILFVSLFILPRKMTFTYAQPTCRSELTLAPRLHKVSTTSTFSPLYKRGISFGGIQLVATQTCLIGKQAPQEGNAIMTVRPLSFIPLGIHYTIKVDDPPRILTSGQTISQALSKELEFPLSKPDAVFRYQLKRYTNYLPHKRDRTITRKFVHTHT